MNKRGFTLIEILAIIVTAGLLLGISVPSILAISKRMNQTSYDKKVVLIQKSADLYADDNQSFLKAVYDEQASQDQKELYIYDLIRSGYVKAEKDDNILDPRTQRSMNCDPIIINKNKEKYYLLVSEIDEKDIPSFSYEEEELKTCRSDLKTVTFENNDGVPLPIEKNPIKMENGKVITLPKLDNRLLVLSFDPGQQAEMTLINQNPIYVENVGYKILSENTGGARITDGFKLKMGTKNINIVALWSENKKEYTCPTAYKQDHNLLGWYTDPDNGTKMCGEGGKFIPKKSMTLYAHWNYVEPSNPICKWTSGPTVSNPSNIQIGDTATYILTCTDKVSLSDSDLTINDFSSSNVNVATVTNISNKTTITGGYQYTITAKVKGGGSAQFKVKQGALKNKFGYYNNESALSNALVSDNTPPKCVWESGPTGTMKNGYVTKNQTLTYVLKCTESSTFNDKIITTSDITTSNSNVATITNIGSATAITGGYKWTITAKAGSTTGNATFKLKAGSVSDAASNKNVESASSAAFKNDCTSPTINSVTNSSNSNWTTKTNITVTGSDSHSGITGASSYQYDYYDGVSRSDWTSGGTSSKVVGTWTSSRNSHVRVRVYDALGNYSAWVDAGYVRIENFYISHTPAACDGYDFYGYWFNCEMYFYPHDYGSGINYNTVRGITTDCGWLYYGNGYDGCQAFVWNPTVWNPGLDYGDATLYACTYAGHCAQETG